MSNNENPVNEKKVTKKEVRKEIYEKLSLALADYKESLNEKKFESKIKKAAKLFVVDIAKGAKKNLRKAAKGKIKIT